MGFEENMLDEIIEDFQLSNDFFNNLDYKLYRELKPSYDFNWLEYYKNNLKKIPHFDDIFCKIFNEKNKVDLYLNNSEYYLQKYRNITKKYVVKYSGNENEYDDNFNLADFLWKCSFNKEYIWNKPILTFSYEKIIELIPIVNNIGRKFIYLLFDYEDYSVKRENKDLLEKVMERIIEFMGNKMGDEELEILYCRGSVKILEKLNLEVNDFLLQKALIYKRYLVIKLLDERGLLEKHNNPFSLNLINDINSVNDIWYGWGWGNDECERKIVNKNNINLDECINICKKHFELKIDYIEKWSEISNYRNNGYDIRINDIIKYFIEEDKLKSREEIRRYVSIIGKEIMWKILRKKGDDILDILLG